MTPPVLKCARLLPVVLLLLLNCGNAARLVDELSGIFGYAAGKLKQAYSGVIPAPESSQDVSADFPDGDDTTIRTHWAVVVAGSSGWGNYRHQADACHAYQVLRRGGLLESHIVMMMYDDIAGNAMNPYPGKIFNKPGGQDVYHNVPRDYTGRDVNSEVFLAVLTGDRRAVAGRGSGKVISSGPHDRVFVFYSDHGSAGVLGMPSGPFLFADELNYAIGNKSAAGGFKEAVLYIEACESGSMFEGLLPQNVNVYATTAANAVESSWGTYCPGMDPSPPEEFSTCLGDLYSVSWMENAELADLTRETVGDQVDLVTQRTSNNFTYVQGSHVMEYGQAKVKKEKAGDYEGMLHNGKQQYPLWHGQRAGNDNVEPPPNTWTNMEQRDADLLPLRIAVSRAKDPAQKAAAEAELKAALEHRQWVDSAARSAARLLLLHPSTSTALMTRLGWTREMLFSNAGPSGGSGSLNLLSPSPHYLDALVSAPLQDRPSRGRPLVDDWDCLRAHVDTWQASCGVMDQYAMKLTRFFANLCNAGLAASDLHHVLQLSACSKSAKSQL